MPMELLQPVVIIGAACLLAAFVAYLRDTSKAIFPIVLALIGVFLCGAQVVKATLPGGGSVELSNQVSQTVDASSDAIAKQNTALQALGARIDTLQSAVQALQTVLNTRLAQANTPPVQLPQIQALDASQASVSSALKESQIAHQKLVVQSAALRNAVKEFSPGQ